MKKFETQLKKDIVSYLKYGNGFPNKDNFLQFVRRGLDLRTKFAKEYLGFLSSKSSFLRNFDWEGEKKSILVKRKNRRINKESKEMFVSILDNPFVKDYFNNKQFLEYVNNEYMKFGLRKHWAKKNTDFNLLKIIKKYEKEKRNK